MLQGIYQGSKFSQVTNLADFYKTNLPEMSKIRSLVEGIKLLFGIPQTNLLIEVAEGERVYKITLLSSDVHKYPFGYFVYLPLERRLDAYTMDNPEIPLLQWKNKKPVFKGFSMFLDRAGISTIFDKLVNVI